MAVKYDFDCCKNVEKEKIKIIQNLSVIAHELYFRNEKCSGESADQIAEAVKFINWLYEQVYGR